MKKILTGVLSLLFLSPLAYGAKTESSIVVPSAAEGSLRISESKEVNTKRAPESGNWTSIGEGTYKEILLSDLFDLPAQTLKVNFERNADDPTMFRITNVYENMDLSAYGDALTFDADKAEPMVFHVFDDQYAYFDEFGTGIHIDYTKGTNSYNGDVRMLMQGVDLLAYNDIYTLIKYLPQSLCQFSNGNLTMASTFNLEGSTWSNILGLVYVTGTPYDPLFRGNVKGDFLITMPDAQNYDPDEDWEDIGMALYTDALTEAFFSNPQYPTYEVKMQKNIIYPDRYRLVNPYENWPLYNDQITYDKDNNYYMELIMEEYDNYTLVGIPTFYTGIQVNGYGSYAVSNQAANYLDQYYFIDLYSNWPGCLGLLEDGVITYSSYCVIDFSEMYDNFFGYFGAFSWDKEFYSANHSGKFKIEMPKNDDSAVKGIEIGETDEAPVYYTLDGVKVSNPGKGIFVKVQGGKAEKVIKN